MIYKNNEHIGLYIHIPFCLKKCFYCDFCSNIYNKYEHDAYINNLLKEIDIIKLEFKNSIIDTIFIGGGTPSLLSNALIEKLMKKVEESFNIAKNAEISCEVNPETINDQLINGLLKNGFNRISIGIQSTNDKVLNAIGRIHNAETGIKSIETAIKNGFSNINVDLMYGLPEQNVDIHCQTLRAVANMKIQHISAYNLIVEEGTVLKQKLDNGMIIIPNEDEQIQMYEDTKRVLENFKFEQYEISNYAKLNYECKHNIGYWERKAYAGIGLSAHGYIYLNNEFIRYSNPNDMQEYTNNIQNEIVFGNIEIIDKEKAIFETIMLGLRMVKGINEETFYKNFNISIDEYCGNEIAELTKQGLINREKGYLFLTEKGIGLQNYVLVKILK